MTMSLTPTLATLSDVIGIDDTDTLRDWCVAASTAGPPMVDLRHCTHLHAATLQVLMAARAQVCMLPEHEGLAVWVRQALSLSSSPTTDD